MRRQKKFTDRCIVAELREVAEKYYERSKHLDTFETDINAMATDAANHIEIMAEEFNQLMEDFKSVVYHTKTKSANMCNFCKKDCGEGGQPCRGKEDWVYCSFEWRGIVETQADGE